MGVIVAVEQSFVGCSNMCERQLEKRDPEYNGKSTSITIIYYAGGSACFERRRSNILKPELMMLTIMGQLIE